MSTSLLPAASSRGDLQMIPTELLDALRQSGCIPSIREGRLVVQGSREYLEGLQDEIRRHEGDLVALLQAEVAAPLPPVTLSIAPGDDGRRVWLRAMGELLGWPRLPIGLGAAITAGQDAWISFTACARNDECVDQAVAVLGEVGSLPHEEIEEAAEAWWRR
jgi:hypothetical protein